MLANFTSWIIFGALIGWIISQVSATSSATEERINILIGIMATFLIGLVLQSLNGSRIVSFNVAILIVAILCSVLLLATIRGFSRRLRD